MHVVQWGTRVLYLDFFWSPGAGPARKRAIRALSEVRAKKLRAAFQLTDASPLKARSLRDALEHL